MGLGLLRVIKLRGYSPGWEFQNPSHAWKQWVFDVGRIGVTLTLEVQNRGLNVRLTGSSRSVNLLTYRFAHHQLEEKVSELFELEGFDCLSSWLLAAFFSDLVKLLDKSDLTDPDSLLELFQSEINRFIFPAGKS